MIKHVVMWWLRDSEDGVSRQENAQRLKAMLEALTASVPGIAALEVGINMIEDEAAADVVLVSAFADQAALDAYQKHPEHLKVAEFVKRVRTERRVVDYDG
jgi:quinol monooxygenase YgiN